MSIDVAALGTVPAPHGPGRRRSAAELEAIAREAAVRFADATADEVLAWAATTFGDSLAVACSMAGDTVVPHLVAQHSPGVDVLFLQTGYHFPETIGTRDALPLSADVTIVDVLPVQSVAEQDATFGAKLHDRDPSQCCALRKMEPINRELASYEAWVTGLRREDSPLRADTPLVEWDSAHQMVKLNPIAAWGFDEVLNYAGAHGVPVNLLLTQGYPSIGCAPCTRPVAPGEDPRAGRWAGLAKSECGLHVTDTHPEEEPLSLDIDLSLAGGGISLAPDRQLSHLRELEAEGIHIIREAVSELERPVLLFSGGKDSVVMLHLALKAFWPGPVPFPVMHVDTGHNFPEVIEYRDRVVAQHGLRLVVASVQDYIDDGRLLERADGTRNPLQTQPLLDAIADFRFDAVFGGGRRDEEKARAKERVVSLRDEFGQWDPRNQRPELWTLYNPRHRPGEHVRVFPLSNWTELDVWRYIEAEDIELPELYYAHDREVFERDGMWLAVGEVSQPRDGEEVVTRQVRYRTVGDMSCTGAVVSEALTVADVIAEVAATRITERGATRADDRLTEAAMEDRKKEGYF
ncbi:MAG: sulfate adenylyltransferase subunit CysD [Tessaracoccus sp.]|nr:sulfate adenylyltransferase subunit CysD [Tessaracoccus sp.]